MKEHQCDVVVVGGGLAGLIAAAKASSEGKAVIVLERKLEESYLCASRITAGVFHTIQKDVLSDPDSLLETILARVGDVARPDLARAVAVDGIRAIKWLQSQGVRFVRGPESYQSFVLAPPNLVRVGLDWRGRGGDVTLRTLERLLLAKGGRLLRGHRAVALLGNPATGVEGVEGEGPDAPFTVRARAVILADGGFQSDPALVSAHISPAPEKLLQRNAQSGFGDGLRMALAFGAASTRLDGFYGHVQARAALENANLWPYPWLDDIATAGIAVGADGRRFANEGHGGVHIANRIAALEDPLSAVIVFDEEIWRTGGKARFFPANPNIIENGATIHKADTIEALAALAGLPPEALAGEVARYNAAIEAGGLDRLAPARSEERFAARPIAAPPFYAAPACAGITYTMGGIAIDASARALDASGDPIAGLYAAGSATGGLEGGDRTAYVGGLVKAAVTGLRAAEHVLGRQDG